MLQSILRDKLQDTITAIITFDNEVFYLLLEDGGYLLLEDGGRIIL